MSENGTFWKRSPKWINLKTPAKCVSVDSENGTFWKRWRHNSPVTLGTRLSGQRSGAVATFQCGQRNSLKTINVDGEHFIRFRSKSCVFKFIRLSVDVASNNVLRLKALGLQRDIKVFWACSPREALWLQAYCVRKLWGAGPIDGSGRKIKGWLISELNSGRTLQIWVFCFVFRDSTDRVIFLSACK